MKGKKVLKVFLVAMVVVTMLAQVSAFAADPTYTTSTTYDVETNKAKVTSTVYNISAGEEVTFLVERVNAEAVNEILYIDQATAVEGDSSASFTYLVDPSKADKTATVKVASTTNAASAVTPVDGGVGATPTPGDDDTIYLESAKLNYSIVGKGTVFIDEASIAAADSANVASGSKTPVYNGQKVTFHCAPDVGYEFAGYKVDGGELITADIANDKFSYTADGIEKTITIYFDQISDVAVSDSLEIQVDETEAISDDVVVSSRSFAQFVTISTGAEKATEYGILVSKDQDEIAAISASNAIDGLSFGENNAVRKFAALGSYENKYAVQLTDSREENNYFADGTVYVRAYAKAKGATGDIYAISDVYSVDLVNGTVENITSVE